MAVSDFMKKLTEQVGSVSEDILGIANAYDSLFKGDKAVPVQTTVPTTQAAAAATTATPPPMSQNTMLMIAVVVILAILLLR